MKELTTMRDVEKEPSISKPFQYIFGVSQSPLVDLMSFNSFFVGTYFKRLTTLFSCINPKSV